MSTRYWFKVKVYAISVRKPQFIGLKNTKYTAGRGRGLDNVQSGVNYQVKLKVLHQSNHKSEHPLRIHMYW